MKRAQDLKEPDEILADLVRLRDAYLDRADQIERMIVAGGGIVEPRGEATVSGPVEALAPSRDVLAPRLFRIRATTRTRDRVRVALKDSSMRRSSIIAALARDGGPAVDEREIDALLSGTDPEFVHENRGWWKYVPRSADAARNGKEAE